MNNLVDYRSLFLAQVHAAYRVLARAVEREGDGADSSEVHVISYVQRYGPCAVGQLSRVFGHKGATLTGLLDRLEKRGLLTRTPNPDDRRSWLVRTTPKGRGVVRKLARRVVDTECALRANIADRDYEAFLRVIDAIKQLETQRVTPDGDSHATADPE
jgi:DNA-binding MarR family transcriptional regulator